MATFRFPRLPSLFLIGHSSFSGFRSFDHTNSSSKANITAQRAEIPHHTLFPKEGMVLLPKKRVWLVGLRSPPHPALTVDSYGVAEGPAQRSEVVHRAFFPKERMRCKEGGIVWIYD